MAKTHEIYDTTSTKPRHARIDWHSVFQVPVQSFAQVGQTAMSQPSGVNNGVVNRGLGAIGSLNDAGPGFFYYGVNGAGRGLGYFGSYMTLGGSFRMPRMTLVVSGLLTFEHTFQPMVGFSQTLVLSESNLLTVARFLALACTGIMTAT